MARKSRRSQAAASEHLEAVGLLNKKRQEELLRTAVYGRLSVENGGNETDESLQTQMLMLYQFVESHPDLKLEESYTDNGYSGTNFDRPEFVRLMDDVRNGRIQCIVVKDLSRFGRDYLETGYYLETLFPHLNVRFIAVTDEFDSSREEDRSSLAVPIKNMVNEMYAKDISRKMCAASKVRLEKLETLPGGTAPYGYVFSEDRTQYIPDADTAAVVRMSFVWTTMGVSIKNIAERFALMGFDTPGQKRYMQVGRQPKAGTWRADMVYKILTHPCYTGDLYRGRIRQALYKSEKCHRTSPEEWFVRRNAFEPLVTREDFQTAKEIMDSNNRKKKPAQEVCDEELEQLPDNFPNMLYCADCGRAMYFARYMHDYVSRKRTVACYVCNSPIATAPCGRRTVYDDFLKIVVMDQIHVLIKSMCDRKKLLDKITTSRDGKNILLSTQKKMLALSVKISEMEEKRTQLYMDYAEGIVEWEDYQSIKERYISEKQKMEDELAALEQKRVRMERTIHRYTELTNHLEQYLDVRDFNAELVKELVERISFSGKKGIEITFKCSDVLQEIAEMMEGADME